MLKVSQVRWAPQKVRAPNILHPKNMHPSASKIMVSVVWVRYVLLTAEMINAIDDAVVQDSTNDLEGEVEIFCLKLENLMGEWNMEDTMHDISRDEALRWLIADHVMTIYATIIGMKRLIRQPGATTTVDATTLRAARKVAQVTLDFTIGPSGAGQTQATCVQYVKTHMQLHIC
jgi:hypothetical protein